MSAVKRQHDEITEEEGEHYDTESVDPVPTTGQDETFEPESVDPRATAGQDHQSLLHTATAATRFYIESAQCHNDDLKEQLDSALEDRDDMRACVVRAKDALDMAQRAVEKADRKIERLGQRLEGATRRLEAARKFTGRRTRSRGESDEVGESDEGERKVRGNSAASPNPDPMLDIIARQWTSKKGGHADNALRIAVCQALQKNKPAFIARHIRMNVNILGAKRFDGCWAKDLEYQSTLQKIVRIKKMMAKGTFDELLNTGEEGMDGTAKRAREKSLRSKSVRTGARGRLPHVTNPDNETEEKLHEKLKEYWADDKCVSRAVIFRTVLEIDSMFKVGGGLGDKGSSEHLRRLMDWFYFGFQRRYYLSNRKLSSVGQKLPDRWEMHLRDLQERIAAEQYPHHINIGVGDDEELVMVPGVDDEDAYNFDHVPVWYEPGGNYSWGSKDSGSRNVKTGGKENFRITVVLTISKCGKKLIPFIIFKAAPAEKGTKCGNSASVTAEIRARSDDKYGNSYPPRKKCYITVSKTANSNEELTVLYEKKVLLPGAGVRNNAEQFDKRVLALCDDFKGHSAAGCKEFNTGHPERRKMLQWEIMKGGLTPVGQPLDKVVNKVFKGFLREVYDIWALTAPIDQTTGAPVPPTRQQVATWVVEAWDRVPEELCAEAWTACGYKTKKELECDKETAIVPYSDEQVGELVRRVCGEHAFTSFQDEACVGADPMFPEEDDDCDE